MAVFVAILTEEGRKGQREKGKRRKHKGSTRSPNLMHLTGPTFSHERGSSSAIELKRELT
jgi:hypothetical protein